MAQRKGSKKVALADATEAPVPNASAGTGRARLHKLRIQNFRCIGSTPVEIDLDEIVVLVGKNNVGKSSILRAYELVMRDGSDECRMEIDDFPNGEVDKNHPATIEIVTVAHPDELPGAEWIQRDPTTGEPLIRERWEWREAGRPVRSGFNASTGTWDTRVPWGAATIAMARRPNPIRIRPFDSPAEISKAILGLLKKAFEARLEEHATHEGDPDQKPAHPLGDLLKATRELQEGIAREAEVAMRAIASALGEHVREVFPGYEVRVDAGPVQDLEKSVASLISPEIRLGPSDGHFTTLDRQGSGACRTLLWAAIRILSELKTAKKSSGSERAQVILIDEPELCLHPDAIRNACAGLYDLPTRGSWQVMITTHSPVFIDLARDNTSIVRVERQQSGEITGTTIFRPQRAQLDEDDKRNLKLLNLFDPYVAEFFFGGRTVIVEGDTEYTAFRLAIDEARDEFRDVHIVRARGKYTIISLCKILNQFGSRYSILHDADQPINKTKTKNAAWTANEKILDVTRVGMQAAKVRLVASIPGFERAFFGKEATGEKPASAWEQIRGDVTLLKKMQDLLRCLVDFKAPVPSGGLEWKSVEELERAVKSAGR